VVLLVDRPETAHVLRADGSLEARGVAVVCVDGSPRQLVAALARGFRDGRRASVLYLHDAITVLFPFSVEPIATLVRLQRAADPLVYVDLGLPPLGATARRFGDATLPHDTLIMELGAIPPATLVRYCLDAAERLPHG